MSRIVGIDPAPKKGLVVFEVQRGWSRVLPADARAWYRDLASAEGGHVVVGWDAPLWADGEHGGPARYWGRPVEELLRGLWPGAAVQPYSGCPHWAISLGVTGYPAPDWLVGSTARPFPLVTDLHGPVRSGLVETHPAVALAVLWDARQGSRRGPFPLYKDRKGSVADVAKATKKLERFLTRTVPNWIPTPDPSSVPTGDPPVRRDDLVDSQVSYLCAQAAAAGTAVLLGDPDGGGFAIPTEWLHPDDAAKNGVDLVRAVADRARR